LSPGNGVSVHARVMWLLVWYL